MSCIACECFAKRITNIFRDEELKLKYNELTNCVIHSDCFICDDCNDKLESSFFFKQQCINVYRKLNPDVFEEVAEKSESDDIKQHRADKKDEIFEYVEETEEASLEEKEEEELDDEEEYVMTVDQTHEEIASGNEEPLLYYEFEDTEENPPLDVKLKKDPSGRAQKPIVSRKSYTVQEKLKIIEYAEEHNNRVAARNFNLNESSVRCFRRQKDVLLKMNPDKKTNRKAFPHWPNLEMELKEFVLNYPSTHGTKAKLKDIKKAAIEIASRHGIENFNGSNSYIFKFMLRHQLPSASPRPRKVKKEAIGVVKLESKSSAPVLHVSFVRSE